MSWLNERFILGALPMAWRAGSGVNVLACAVVETCTGNVLTGWRYKAVGKRAGPTIDPYQFWYGSIVGPACLCKRKYYDV